MTQATENSGRLSLAGYAHILKAVVRGNATWRKISAKQGIGRLTIQRILHYWTDVGLIHVCGWDIPNGVIQARCRIYKFGPGQNVPWPGGELPHQTKVRADLTMFTAVIRALMAGACLKEDVVSEAGISRSACTALVGLLHSLKLIYVADYEERPQRGQGHPMYRWGPGRPDQAKREPMTVEELRRRTNQRLAARRRASKQHQHFAGFAAANGVSVA